MSTVIKPGQNVHLVNRLTTLDLADHLAEARKLVADARGEARDILAQARREAAVAFEAAKEKGHAAGFDQGRQAGLEAGLAQALEEARERFEGEIGHVRDTLTTLVTELEHRKRDLLIAARHDVLEFAVTLARRVARRVGELDRSAATANLEEALGLVSSKTDLTVRVNPLDGEAMRRFAEVQSQSLENLAHLRVVEDPEVTPGGCKVSTAATQIDAGIDTQMDEIVRLLLGGTHP